MPCICTPLLTRLPAFFHLPADRHFEYYRRVIFRYVYTSVTLLFFLLMLPSLYFIFNDMKTYIQNDINDDTAIRSTAVNNWLGHKDQLAMQVTSRTQIRLQLEKYEAGQVTLQELTDFTTPKLEDAMNYSKGEILGIARADSGGRIFSACGLSIPEELNFRHSRDGSISYSEFGGNGNADFFVIRAAIKDATGNTVGWDHIVTSFNDLRESVANREAAESGFILCQASSHVISGSMPCEELRSLLLNSDFEALRSAPLNTEIDDMLVSARSVENFPEWIICMTYDKNELYTPILLRISLILSVGLIIYLIVILILRWKLNPLGTKMLLDQKELESEVRDKTWELNKALEDLKESQNSLVNREKYVTIAQLSSGMAHDFNNIFAGIIFGTEVLSPSADSDPDIKSTVENIRMGAERGAKLIRQLLDFSQRSLKSSENILLCEELRSVIDYFNDLPDSAVPINYTEQPDLDCRLNIDGGQFRRLVSAVMENALQSLADGQTDPVEVRLELKDFHEKHDCPTCGQKVSGRYFSISIEDKGSGIAPEDISHIFEPFYTTRAIGRGSGLGLSQVHGILQQNSGHIFVNSILGKGTLMEILLPESASENESSPSFGPDRGRWIRQV